MKVIKNVERCVFLEVFETLNSIAAKKIEKEENLEEWTRRLKRKDLHLCSGGVLTLFDTNYECYLLMETIGFIQPAYHRKMVETAKEKTELLWQNRNKCQLSCEIDSEKEGAVLCGNMILAFSSEYIRYIDEAIIVSALLHFKWITFDDLDAYIDKSNNPFTARLYVLSSKEIDLF